MSLEDDLFDLQLKLEDCSIERVRTAGEMLRPLTNAQNRHFFALAVLAALAESPLLSEPERMERFLAFADALDMEPSAVVSVLEQWKAAGEGT